MWAEVGHTVTIQCFVGGAATDQGVCLAVTGNLRHEKWLSTGLQNFTHSKVVGGDTELEAPTLLGGAIIHIPCATSNTKGS